MAAIASGTKEVILEPNTVLPSIGKCIYCGSIDNLTDEHLIPLSLGGTVILLDGSCKECQKATHAIEGHVAGRMFKALRVHHQLPTRRPKDRPKELIVLHGSAPERSTPVAIAVGDAPGIVVFPIFDVPSLVSGYSAGMIGAGMYATTRDYKDRTVKLKSTSLPDGGIAQTDFNPHKFLRVLAKIAHCCAVEHFGELVQSELAPIILDRDCNPLTHVGCPTEEMKILPPPSTDTLHQVGTDTRDLRGERYLFFNIRLFGYLGDPPTPEYSVIVGRFLGEDE